MFKKIVATDDAKARFLIRLIIGTVFFFDGIQQFLFAEKLGAVRFAKIGRLSLDFLGSFVGTFEIIYRRQVLSGLVTNISAIPLLMIMLVAIVTAKAAFLADNGSLDKAYYLKIP